MAVKTTLVPETNDVCTGVTQVAPQEIVGEAGEVEITDPVPVPVLVTVRTNVGKALTVMGTVSEAEL